MKKLTLTITATAAALALAGCGSVHAATATTVAATRPALPTAAQTAIAASVASACTAAQAVATQAYALHGLAPAAMLASIHSESTAWQAELKAGEQPKGNGVPEGENAANMANVGLAGAVLALAFGDLAYDAGETDQAIRDYTKFARGLNRMRSQYCGN